jgi:hypothetical protein
MATGEQFDAVIKAVVDNVMVSTGMALRLDLHPDAIADALTLGFIERRSRDLYPTEAGQEYRHGIEDED